MILLFFFIFINSRKKERRESDSINYENLLFNQNIFSSIFATFDLKISSCIFTNIQINESIINSRKSNPVEIMDTCFDSIFGSIYLNQKSEYEKFSRITVSNCRSNDTALFKSLGCKSRHSIFIFSCKNCSTFSTELQKQNLICKSQLFSILVKKSHNVNINISYAKRCQLISLHPRKLPSIKLSLFSNNSCKHISSLLELRHCEMNTILFKNNKAKDSLIYVERASIFDNIVFMNNKAKFGLISEKESSIQNCDFGLLTATINYETYKKSNNRRILSSEDSIENNSTTTIKTKTSNNCNLNSFIVINLITIFVVVVLIIINCASCIKGKKQKTQIHGEMSGEASEKETSNINSDESTNDSSKVPTKATNETTDDSYMAYDSHFQGLNYDTQETSPTSMNGGKYCSIPGVDNSPPIPISTRDTSKYFRSELEFSSNNLLNDNQPTNSNN